MISAKQIAQAKLEVEYCGEVLHQHDDSIRIAYEWLDAQVKTQSPIQKSRALKHMIENWGGRYVSQADVEVAAYLHPEVIGKYPRFNISSKLRLPSDSRLSEISQARTQTYSMDNDEADYRSKE